MFNVTGFFIVIVKICTVDNVAHTVMIVTQQEVLCVYVLVVMLFAAVINICAVLISVSVL